MADHSADEISDNSASHQNSDPVVVREGIASDICYCLHSWGRAAESYQFQEAKRTHQHHPTPGYVQRFAPIQADLLKRSTVLVAHPADKPDRICGYIIFERAAPVTVVHWLSVRRSLYGQGFARLLMAHAGISTDTPIIYTSPSPVIGALGVKANNWQYVPHWLLPKTR